MVIIWAADYSLMVCYITAGYDTKIGWDLIFVHL